ncbi:hypothetical protein [Nakamurella deserti]|uniref:hypothetical protein n=1 Tax=Nakamurella deserti TaxID=2164074 RepID=UPI000DBE63E8|nr:hypothetical protein [Nakamurella deserti]
MTRTLDDRPTRPDDPPVSPADGVPVPEPAAVPGTRPDGAATAAARTGGFARRHRLLLLALVLVLVFHGALLLSGSYQRTYDAYVHIFFGDHYRRDWFSSWDTRWYTGFSVLSYPPGSHQAIAAVSAVFGLRGGFVVVQLCALLNLTIGVYRWSMIWVDRRSAGWAAVLLVLSSSIAETVHVFGQLPTTFSLGFLLNSLPFADRWVRTGDRRALLAGIACTMATTAGHHVTTLFGAVFFLGPVLVSGVVGALRTPHPDEAAGHPVRVGRRLLWPLVARRLRRMLPAVLRAGVYGTLLVMALLTVVLPYWLYSRSDPITQISIPHASRDNFLVNVNAGLVFWLIPWGTTLLVLPYAIVRGLASKAWPLALSLGVLAFFGTGGTTPFPKLLLGGAYDILTLDRFTFWATISILPLAGRFVASVVGGTVRRWLVGQVGTVLAALLPLLLLAAHLATTLFAANLTHYRAFQPAAIDVTPITTFIDKDNHGNWRYLTLGFGDQMAWLGANTTAGTVDGNYHSARQLPELTTRPVERLEGAKYSGVPGIGSLQQFLAVPERYSLKYVFSNDDFYSPLLDANGWTDLGPLENGIEVWERADVTPLAVDIGSHQAPLWQRLMWGTVPPASLLFALCVLFWSALGQPGRLPGWRWLRWISSRGRRIGRWTTAPLRSAGRRVDRRLARAAAPLSAPHTGAAAAVPAATAGAGDRWQPWRPTLERLRGLSAARIPRRRRRLQALAVVAVLAVAGTGGAAVLVRPPERTPEQVVTDYYDHLDFRRFADAWALLDPRTRPDFMQYQKDLGRDGGLVASFAKLASVTAVPTASSPGRTVLTTTADYLTSLQSYQVTGEVVLLQEDDRWYIDLPAADASVAPDEFTSRPEVGFLALGRRTPGNTETSTADILDRPELTLTQVRSMLVNGRWVVIGQVTNADVDPADVTVSAQLRDPEGELLASWDASQVMVHKLLPGESSPFRIEFQSIAGTGSYGTEADGGVKDTGTGGALTVAPPVQKTSNVKGPVEFDPQTITPLVLRPGADVASVGVYARAVVTPHTSTRGLQVTDLRLDTNADGSFVTGSLRNDTAVAAAVPHLLLGYTDAAGDLVWVDHAYLEHSVAAQSSTTFRIAVADSAGITASGVPTAGFAGPAHTPVDGPDAAVGGLPPMLSLPADTGFAGVSLLATAFIRGG